jgi:His-Xaa-Ser system protein HxsD
MKSNFEIKGDDAIIKINKNIYPKEVLTQATYVKLNDFYFLTDEEENYYVITMRYKEKNEKNNLTQAVYEFLDELIESQAYINQLTRTSKIRELILEKALLGQTLDDETIESISQEEETKQQ